MPSVGFSSNNARVTEGHAGTKLLTFTVQLSAASSAAVTVNYATAASSATPGEDYMDKVGSLIFAPGEISRSISIEVRGDTVYEPQEWFRIDLTSAIGAELVQSGAEGFRSPWALGYIENDDAAATPTVGLPTNNARVTEGDAGSKLLTFTVQLSAAAGAPVTVNYATEGSSATAGQDYVDKVGSLVFAPGEISKNVSVEVLGDTVYEPQEWFRFSLTSATGAQLVASGAEGFRSQWALGYIENDDVAGRPTVGLPTNNARVTEGDSGTTLLTFTVQLAAASTTAVTVNYATSSSSATPGEDYRERVGSVVFAPGEISKNVSIEILGDTTYEAQEWFRFSLTSASGADLVSSGAEGFRSPWALGYIENDDPAPAGPRLFVGTGAADTLVGGSGDDTFRGAAGSDVIDGGPGTDVVQFSGARNDYTIAFDAASSTFSVADRIAGRDATDAVTRVEAFSFTDTTVLASSLVHHMPTASDFVSLVGVHRAFHGRAPDVVTYRAAANEMAQSSPSALANGYGTRADANAATLSGQVLANLGVTPQSLGGATPTLSFDSIRDALTLLFTLYSADRGQVVLNAVKLMANLSDDAVYGRVAREFNDSTLRDLSGLPAGASAPDTLHLVGLVPAREWLGLVE